MDLRRHFSMSAVNALAALRRYLIVHPNAGPEAAAVAIKRSDADFSGADFEAALSLHGLLPPELVFLEFQPSLRAALHLLIVHHRPWWMRAAPYGRERLISTLGRDSGEGQDQLQCLRAAGLFEATPCPEVVTWWDTLAHLVRSDRDEQLLLQGREGERLSLAYERERLKSLGIPLEPRWVAIEDNSAGYDIQSFDVGPVEPVSRLIEVKSSSLEIPHIFISRNEWDSAMRYQGSYVFHIWHLPSNALIERTVAEVGRNIPIDQESGRWTNVEIRVT